MASKHVGLTKDDVYHVLTEFYQNVMLRRFVVKEDLDGLKSDVSSLKLDVGTLKNDVSEFKDDMRRMDRKLDLVSAKVTDIEFDHEKRLVRVEKKLALG